MSAPAEPRPGLTEQELEDAETWARCAFQDLRETVAAGEDAFVAHHIADMQDRIYRRTP